MQFNKYFNISLISITLFLSACCAQNKSKGNKASADVPRLKQTCPDEWIQNRMPGPGTNFEEYYVVNGERKEVKEFDTVWIKKNCNLKPTIVQ